MQKNIYSMHKLAPNKLPKTPYVQLLVSTWSKDSHALYDYQAIDNKFYNESFYLTSSSKVYRHITTMHTNIIDNESTKELAVQNIYIGTLVINKQKNQYKFQSATVSGILPSPIIRQDHPDLFNNSFVVIRDFENQNGYALKPGSVLKLGRVQYVVIEIRDSNSVKTFKQTSHLQLNTKTHLAQTSLEGQCKICLCDQSTQNDPLIAPCLCKGSCQLIHAGCLRNWINSKVKKDINGIAMSYNFSRFECQICKALFPKIIKLQNGQQIDMITIDKPSKPYIIIQSVSDRLENKQQRNLHLLAPQEKSSIKLGRGHQCQIRITDISVSRSHAQMRFQDNKFYIKDLKSKFGTLIKFKQQFQIKSKLRIQYGRTVFEFNLKSQKNETQTNQG